MKLLFCLPNQTIKSRTSGQKHRATISIPLGVLSIAGYIRAKDWQGEMDVYDARLSATVTDVEKEGLVFGDLPETIFKRFQEEQPDVIAISNMFSWQIENAFEMARIAKAACPNCKTIIGGPHVSSFPSETLREEGVDYVVMGEGEERLYEMLLCFEENKEVQIEGVLGKEEDLRLLRPNKKAPIGFITPLDRIPLPAYDMVDVKRYLYLQSHGLSPRSREFAKRAFTILTSRGCPHQCVFCSIQATMGYRWRHHTPEYVKKYIKYIINTYDADFVHFEDDNFTYDTDRYDEILDILLELKPKIKWNTPNGVRGDSWNLERVQKTKKSGCQYLIVAIESAVQRVINEVIKKRLDLSQVDKLMESCKKVKLRLRAFYVIGLPGETKEDIKKTLDFAVTNYDRYNVKPSVNIAMALPGTELHDTVMNDHLFKGEHLKYKPNEIFTQDFDPAFIEDEFNKVQKRIKYLHIKKIFNLREFFYNLKFLKEKYHQRKFKKVYAAKAPKRTEAKVINAPS